MIKKMQINLYQGKHKSNQKIDGKIFARASNRTPIGLEELAEHMMEHGTIYTYDVMVGVMAGAVKCIRELALSGQPVKLPDLCIVSGQVSSTGADSIADFDVDENVSTIRLAFRATGKARRQTVNGEADVEYTSLARQLKAAANGGSTSGGSGSSAGGSGSGNSNTDPNTPTEDIPGEDRP